MDDNIYIKMSGMIIGFAGFMIICCFSNWEVGFGMFLVMFGDNLSEVPGFTKQ